MLRLSSTLLVVCFAVFGAYSSAAQSRDTTDSPPSPPVIDPPPNQLDTTYSTLGPELVGGIDSLNERVRYPSEALEECVEGRLIVLFTVGLNGGVSEVEVPEDYAVSEPYLAYERAARNGMEEEAVRVVNQAHFRWPEDWPEDRERRVRVSLPITFQPPEGSCKK